MEQCNKKVEEGCTAIGLAFAWHGNADICLDERIPVLVTSTEIDDGIDDEDAICSCFEDDKNDEAVQPPEAKKLKSSDTADIEEVKNKSSRDVLFRLNVIDQIIAGTITNAFAQVNRSKCLSGTFIPTFGCCYDYFIIVMYDPDNDVLLQSNLIKLWGCYGQLDISAVVLVWMYLNFTQFIRPDLAKKYSFNQSRFHGCVKDFLKHYKEASCNKSLGPSDVNYYGDVVVPHMFEVMELVNNTT
ncbi:hypothetical protein FSP39_006689 [Pinctada imbricata]|uniref:Uncharacterized protein n=1 Tax=Pinctada imbricata TaxID=66713 RepID=A0AA88YHP9_PINIB|nr:hypothetical protein FSP39_006689 [Pinctada imbricata]